MTRGFAIDMDGTVYHSGVAIPGAVDFIKGLKKRNIPFRFLTNNSSHSRDFYLKRLTSMGFDVSIDDILSSTIATARYILSKHPEKTVYAVCTPDVESELRGYGIQINSEDPDIVLLTFDTTITYEKINRAYQFLKSGKIFIATHPDDLCPTAEGYDIDIGPFIRMFSQMADNEPVVIGKPNRLMLEMAALEIKIGTSDVIMVGDRIYTDMKMAADNNSPSIAVLTGEATREQIAESGIVPSAICNSVADILNLDLESL